ncbi:PREDICTED: protein arv1 homolog isoform X3 [Populus euphratica]|uniref:Protein ARV n=1 Tax=Populus euphratica TaxID=75702 RepID=A0AAJ6XNN0_POPEU|nr:PREDICTED: protein arv1 homolog isoform X3 [Populus euphratica]
MEHRCAEYGFPIETLFVQYSPGNIQLMRCANCEAVADEYIECEFMGLLWKSIFVFLLLDANRSLLLKRNAGEWGSSVSFSSIVSTFQEYFLLQILVDVFVGNFMFICVFLLSMRLLLNTSIQISRCRDILLAVLVSSHFKIFLIATMVWEFPFSVIFIIDLFVLSSNMVALKVFSEPAMNRCIAACFCARAVKLLVTQISTQISLRF